MAWSDFWLLTLSCAAVILICRTAPLFVLKGRELKPSTRRALQMIPAAAFAALVANDLFKPDLWALGVWSGAMPIVAACVVVAVAVKTRNLLACACTGVAVYGLLMLV